jgi:hypothetical protein
VQRDTSKFSTQTTVHTRWLTALCLVAACGGDPDGAAPGGDDDDQGGSSQVEDGGSASGDARTNGSDSDGGSGSGSAGGDSGGSGAGSAGGDSSTSQGPMNSCDVQVVRATQAVPDMLVVLDRSSSMLPDGNDQKTDRWAGSVSAVVDVTRAFDERVNFGLVTYPGPQATGKRGDPNACSTGALRVGIDEKRGGAIASTLSMTRPGGYTPTAATLREVAKVFAMREIGDQNVVAPRYIMLVTDGDPNCANGTSSPLSNDPIARQQTIDAIAELTKSGVQTFVVGYQTGTTDFAATLDQMATAGGTGQSKHRSVESGADLTAVFEDIAGRAVSCSYTLEAPVDDHDFVVVTVNGKKRDYQAPNDGWSLGPDHQTVTVTGAACDEVRKGATFGVQVVCEQQFYQ